MKNKRPVQGIENFISFWVNDEITHMKWANIFISHATANALLHFEVCLTRNFQSKVQGQEKCMNKP